MTITPELIAEHNLTSEEYERILGILGREPNVLEHPIVLILNNPREFPSASFKKLPRSRQSARAPDSFTIFAKRA
jgi:hypothetical protein